MAAIRIELRSSPIYSVGTVSRRRLGNYAYSGCRIPHPPARRGTETRVAGREGWRRKVSPSGEGGDAPPAGGAAAVRGRPQSGKSDALRPPPDAVARSGPSTRPLAPDSR